MCPIAVPNEQSTNFSIISTDDLILSPGFNVINTLIKSKHKSLTVIGKNIGDNITVINAVYTPDYDGDIIIHVNSIGTNEIPKGTSLASVKLNICK